MKQWRLISHRRLHALGVALIDKRSTWTAASVCAHSSVQPLDGAFACAAHTDAELRGYAYAHARADQANGEHLRADTEQDLTVHGAVQNHHGQRTKASKHCMLPSCDEASA